MATDEELMLSLSGGDLAALEKIVRRYQGLAWSVAYRFSGDRIEAEDVAQEAFLRLLDSAGRDRPVRSFRAYFYRVVTHLCLDAARKKRPAPADLNDLPSTSPEGAERLALGDRAAAVRHALATLPANQRAAVILRYYENLGYREIAESLGCSEKAVERLLARARAALAALLEGMLEN